MKRSRRVVLTMMGTAAVGAVSMGFVRQRDCGPGARGGAGPGRQSPIAGRCMAASAARSTVSPCHGHGHAHGGG